MSIIKNFIDAIVISMVIFFTGFFVFGFNAIHIVKPLFFSPIGLVTLVLLAFVEYSGLRG